MGKTIKNKDKSKYLNVTGNEFMELIKKFGYSQREFAKEIGKSQGFVSRTLGMKSIVPWRWVQALKNILNYVGFDDDSFEIALKEIREGE